MYELIQVTKQTYYIDCLAKMGIFKADDQNVYLIDSGNDKDAGKKIQRILDGEGWHLKAILNTHSHADHIGGNHFLQGKNDCSAWSTPLENAFIEHPVLEPSLLYGGYPSAKLRGKFLMAAPSISQDLSKLSLPEGFEYFPLKGHSFDMIGFRTPDQVCFLADCLTASYVLDKYHISFIYDVKEYLNTLDFVEHLNGVLFVPAHAEAVTDIRPLVHENRQKVQEIIENILLLCQTPLTAEELLKLLFDHYKLSMNFEQYALVGSTVRSYLSYLLEEGRISGEFSDNRLLWKTLPRQI